MIFQLLYISKPKRELKTKCLVELLEVARDRNYANGITGYLVHRPEYFLQIIEGPECDVRQLYQKIEADPRHEDACILLENTCRSRLFPNWEMGIHGGASYRMPDVPGFDQEIVPDPLPTQCSPEHDPILRIIQCFANPTTSVARLEDSVS